MLPALRKIEIVEVQNSIPERVTAELQQLAIISEERRRSQVVTPTRASTDDLGPDGAPDVVDTHVDEAIRFLTDPIIRVVPQSDVKRKGLPEMTDDSLHGEGEWSDSEELILSENNQQSYSNFLISKLEASEDCTDFAIFGNPSHNHVSETVRTDIQPLSQRGNYYQYNLSFASFQTENPEPIFGFVFFFLPDTHKIVSEMVSFAVFPEEDSDLYKCSPTTELSFILKSETLNPALQLVVVAHRLLTVKPPSISHLRNVSRFQRIKDKFTANYSAMSNLEGEDALVAADELITQPYLIGFTPLYTHAMRTGPIQVRLYPAQGISDYSTEALCGMIRSFEPRSERDAFMMNLEADMDTLDMIPTTLDDGKSSLAFWENKPSPYLMFMHRLYLSLNSLNLSQYLQQLKPRKRLRNIVVKISLRNNDSTQVEDIVPHSFFNPIKRVLTDFVLTPVIYHSDRPQLNFQYRIELPLKLEAKHHLHFEFFHVVCKQNTNTSRFIPCGAAWMPLFKGYYLKDDSVDKLHIYQKLTEGYLSNAVQKALVRVAPSTPFSVSTRTRSSLYTRDQPLNLFFNTITNVDTNAVGRVGLDGMISAAKNEEILRFAPTILKLLLSKLQYHLYSESRTRRPEDTAPRVSTQLMGLLFTCLAKISHASSTLLRDEEARDNKLLLTFLMYHLQDDSASRSDKKVLPLHIALLACFTNLLGDLAANEVNTMLSATSLRVLRFGWFIFEAVEKLHIVHKETAVSSFSTVVTFESYRRVIDGYKAEMYSAIQHSPFLMSVIAMGRVSAFLERLLALNQPFDPVEAFFADATRYVSFVLSSLNSSGVPLFEHLVTPLTTLTDPIIPFSKAFDRHLSSWSAVDTAKFMTHEAQVYKKLVDAQEAPKEVTKPYPDTPKAEMSPDEPFVEKPPSPVMERRQSSIGNFFPSIKIDHHHVKPAETQAVSDEVYAFYSNRAGTIRFRLIRDIATTSNYWRILIQTLTPALSTGYERMTEAMLRRCVNHNPWAASIISAVFDPLDRNDDDQAAELLQFFVDHMTDLVCQEDVAHLRIFNVYLMFVMELVIRYDGFESLSPHLQKLVFMAVAIICSNAADSNIKRLIDTLASLQNIRFMTIVETGLRLFNKTSIMKVVSNVVDEQYRNRKAASLNEAVRSLHSSTLMMPTQGKSVSLQERLKSSDVLSPRSAVLNQANAMREEKERRKKYLYHMFQQKLLTVLHNKILNLLVKKRKVGRLESPYTLSRVVERIATAYNECVQSGKFPLPSPKYLKEFNLWFTIIRQLLEREKSTQMARTFFCMFLDSTSSSLFTLLSPLLFVSPRQLHKGNMDIEQYSEASIASVLIDYCVRTFNSRRASLTMFAGCLLGILFVRDQMNTRYITMVTITEIATDSNLDAVHLKDNLGMLVENTGSLKLRPDEVFEFKTFIEDLITIVDASHHLRVLERKDAAQRDFEEYYETIHRLAESSRLTPHLEAPWLQYMLKKMRDRAVEQYRVSLKLKKKYRKLFAKDKKKKDYSTLQSQYDEDYDDMSAVFFPVEMGNVALRLGLVFLSTLQKTGSDHLTGFNIPFELTFLQPFFDMFKLQTVNGDEPKLHRKDSVSSLSSNRSKPRRSKLSRRRSVKRSVEVQNVPNLLTSEFTIENCITRLLESCEYFYQAKYFEMALQICDLVRFILDSCGEIQLFAILFDRWAGVYAALAKESALVIRTDKRGLGSRFGTFFLVCFRGTVFDAIFKQPNNETVGHSFVYRMPAFTRSVIINEYLKSVYSAKLTEVHGEPYTIKIVPPEGISPDKMKEGIGYIQCFEIYPEISPHTLPQGAKGRLVKVPVNTFIYKIGFFQEPEAKKEKRIDQKYMKCFRLKTVFDFPHAVGRIPVLTVKSTELTPPVVFAREQLMPKCRQLLDPNESYTSRQGLLSGMLIPQVHAGLPEVFELFYNNQRYRFFREHIDILSEAMRNFFDASKQALFINYNSVLGDSLRAELHWSMVKGYNELLDLFKHKIGYTGMPMEVEEIDIEVDELEDEE
ncbi:hypothetical protein PCE1_003193 [Barthelona sp. PCE]